MRYWPRRVPSAYGLTGRSNHFRPMRSPGFLGGAVADADYAHRLVAREAVVIHYHDVETETVEVG